jgi:hypothetical protein
VSRFNRPSVGSRGVVGDAETLAKQNNLRGRA